jgi:chromosome partitioning protein
LDGVLRRNIDGKLFLPLCAEDKSGKEPAMKSIATVNFKGGVGKTTVSWILAKYAAEKRNKKVLVMDTDAQMSLTLAVQLQESGSLVSDFETWYESTHKRTGKTLLTALEKYDTYASGREKHFDFLCRILVHL